MSNTALLRDAIERHLPPQVLADAAAARHACGPIDRPVIGQLLSSAQGRVHLASALRGSPSSLNASYNMNGRGVGRGSAIANSGGAELAGSELTAQEESRVALWGGVFAEVLGEPAVRSRLLEVDSGLLRSLCKVKEGLQPMCVGEVLEIAAALNAGAGRDDASGGTFLGGLVSRKAFDLAKTPHDRVLAAHARAHAEASRPARQDPSTPWSPRLFSAISKLAVAVLSPLFPTSADSAPPNDSFVVLEAVREKCLAVVRQVFNELEAEGVVSPSGTAVVTKKEFSCAFDACSSPDASLSERKRDKTLVLDYMVKMELALQFDMTTADGYVECYKIAPIDLSYPSPVGAGDRGVLAIRTTLNKLAHQRSHLVRLIEETKSEALKFHRANQQSAALWALRRKKRLEALLDRRLLNIDQLRQVADGITDALTAADVVESLKIGGKALKSLHDRHNLSADSIDVVMLDIAEILADQREIDDALMQGLETATPSVKEDDELNAELEALMTVPAVSLPAGAKGQLVDAARNLQTTASLAEGTVEVDDDFVGQLERLSVSEQPLDRRLPERSSEQDGPSALPA